MEPAMPEEKRDGNVWLGSRTDVTSLRDWITNDLQRPDITPDEQEAFCECLAEGLQALTGMSLAAIEENLAEQRLTLNDTPPADGDMMFRVQLARIATWATPQTQQRRRMFSGLHGQALKFQKGYQAMAFIWELYHGKRYPGETFLLVQNCHTRPSPE